MPPLSPSIRRIDGKSSELVRRFGGKLRNVPQAGQVRLFQSVGCRWPLNPVDTDVHWWTTRAREPSGLHHQKIVIIYLGRVLPILWRNSRLGKGIPYGSRIAGAAASNAGVLGCEYGLRGLMNRGLSEVPCSQGEWLRRVAGSGYRRSWAN